MTGEEWMKRNFLCFCPLLLAAAASAAPVCVTGTLTTYEGLSAGCIVGAVTFSGFGFSSAGTNPITANQVQVTPFTNGTDDGLTFSGPFSVGAGQSLDALITFQATAASLMTATLSNF